MAKRRQIKDNKLKYNGPINYAWKIYGLIIKDITKEVSSTLSDNMMMKTRMNDYTDDITKVRIRHIYFNSKSTSKIGVVKPN